MEKTCFTDICTLIMGQSPDSSSYNTNCEGLPFYQGNSDFGELYPVPRVWCSEPKKIAQENDILISVRAPIGDLNIANEKCCIGRGLAAIRIINSDNVDLTYLYHFFESKKTYLQEKGTGSTFKAINKDSLINFVIPLPSVKEQESISQELSALHLLIKGKKNQLFALDELVKSRFIEMFENKDFGECLFGNICECLRNGANIKQSKAASGYPITRIETLSNDKFNLDRMGYADIFDLEKYRKYLLQTDDILISHINSTAYLGRAVRYKGESNTPIIHGMNLLCARIKPMYNATYIEHYLKSVRAKDYIRSITKQAVNQASISTTELKLMPIPVPPIELQNEFAEFVKLIDKSKFIVQQQIKDLQELLDSKMDEYFR